MNDTASKSTLMETNALKILVKNIAAALLDDITLF